MDAQDRKWLLQQISNLHAMAQTLKLVPPWFSDADFLKWLVETFTAS